MDRKTYQREWQRAKQRKENHTVRVERFKKLLNVVKEYEKEYDLDEIADKLAKDYKWKLTIKENNDDKQRNSVR